MKQVRKFLKKTIKIIGKPEMRVLPGQLAFFFVLSLIPLVALVGAIASVFSISVSSLSSSISASLPSEIATALIDRISGEGLNFNIVVFFVSAFILASNGAHSMIITSNEIYKIKDADVISRRVKAILMTFILVGLLFFLLLVPVFGDKIFSLFYEYCRDTSAVDFMYKVYEIFKYPLTVLVVFFCIKLLYIVSPDEKIPSKSTTYGAVFTTIAWIASTEIYAFYVGSFAHYDIFYGSISNILILLIWVYLLSYIFVAGMALNAYNVESKMLEEKKKSEENTNSKE